jgi:predicted nuclease with TOPRIM domain
MEIINEQTELKSHTAEAEHNLGEGKSEVSLGKFKDVNALIEAYNSLQSEFTKRCQKLKELEGKISLSDKQNPSNEQSASVDKENTNFKDKQQVLKEYLFEILGKKPQAVVMDGQGVGVKAPVLKPMTIGDAGNLAKDFFQK